MKMYKVTVIAMGKHVSDRSNLNESGLTFEKARAMFLEISDRLNLGVDPDDLQEEDNYDAGGIGFDYRVKLETE